jgi:hypothetical protein
MTVQEKGKRPVDGTRTDVAHRVATFDLLSGPTVSIDQPTDPCKVVGAAVVHFSGCTTPTDVGNPDIITSMEYVVDTSFPQNIPPADENADVPFATWSFDLLVPAVRVQTILTVKVKGYTADNRPSNIVIKTITDQPVGPPAPRKLTVESGLGFAPDLHLWPIRSTTRAGQELPVELRLFGGDTSATRVQLSHFVRPDQGEPYWDADLFEPDLLQNIPDNPIPFRSTVVGLHSLVLETRTPGSSPTYEVLLIQVLP